MQGRGNYLTLSHLVRPNRTPAAPIVRITLSHIRLCVATAKLLGQALVVPANDIRKF